MKIKIFTVLLLSSAIIFLTMAKCGEGDNPSDDPIVKDPKPKKEVVVPTFDADAAYDYIQKQVDFGPRVPNTPEHVACGNYLANTLEGFGANVILQEDMVTAYDGTKLRMKNIIAEFQPEKKKRILLMAHWDTRPFADKDTIEALQSKPIDGANDGGSGVGVLLEIASHFKDNPTNYGIDIIFFDTEDYGAPESFQGETNGSTWCLGSQYWSKKTHKSGYRAKYGILLDMVGAEGAKFSKEGTSMEYASTIVTKVWNNAKKSGNGEYFLKDVTGQTTDDHLFVNAFAGIRSIDIVEFQKVVKAMGTQDLEWAYASYHHTHNDNMDIISKETLKAVGETVMYTIYNE